MATFSFKFNSSVVEKFPDDKKLFLEARSRRLMLKAKTMTNLYAREKETKERNAVR